VKTLVLSPSLKRLELTGPLRYRVAAVRRAADLVAADGDLSYSALELVKLELADELLREIEVQTRRVGRLPRRAHNSAIAVLNVQARRRRA
jgi:hypothetical protein